MRRGPQPALFLLTLVLAPFVLTSLFALIILRAPSDRLPATMGSAAAEGATQVAAPRIARIGEEINTAMPAAAQALSPVRFSSQH